MTHRTFAAGKLCVSLFLIPLLVGCAVAPHAPAVSAPVSLVELPPKAPAEPFPLPVIVLDGSGENIGREHAAALGDGIRSLHAAYLTAFFHGATSKFLALATAGMFESKLSPEHRDEVHALASGTAIEERQMLLAQCFLDLMPMVACSTVTLPAGASPDGVARFGRNLDFPSFNIADKSSVILVYKPQGRYQFASVAWPGLVGVLTGMNEHGLTLANMEVSRGPRVPSAMPYTLLYRSVLEHCKTVDEAIEFLRETPRQSANNLMLMDASGDRAVVEIRPEGIEVRRGQRDAALISTNHQRGQDADDPGRCKRYDSLHDASSEQFGSIGVTQIESMLAGASQGKLTLQSMVFEPTNRVIYLSTGKDAAHGEFHKLDLGELFDSGIKDFSPAPLRSGAVSSAR
jgi:isopenicillin-N N-acyltransferase-like protein